MSESRAGVTWSSYRAKLEEIDRLKEEIRYKDLDIEMYQGALINIKKVVDSKQSLQSWQELEGRE